MSVSVVIPTYYRNDLLREAVDCVLTQKGVDAEIVIVDDSGEEHAKPVVDGIDSPDVVYRAHGENKGPASARDSGVAAASGEYIHFLDDDDRLKKRTLEKKIQKTRESSEVGVVYGGLEWEDGHVVSPQPSITGDVLEDMMTFNVAPCLIGTMLVKRELFEEMPPMATLPSDDGAVRIELAKRTQFSFAEEALVERYNTDDSEGESVESAVERLQTIEYYDSLYDEYPPEVKRHALSRTYLLMGSTRLNHTLWSHRSIIEVAKANYWFPGINIAFLGALFASFLGQPGWDLGVDLYTSYLLGDSHEGTFG